VGWLKKGKVYFGSDSQISGDNKHTNATKILKKGEFIFGSTGYARMLTLLKYDFEIPTQKINEPDDKYINVTFLRKLLKTMEERCFAKKENNVLSYDGDIMVGYKGGIYSIDGLFHIHDCGQFWSVGSGSSHALGSLYTSSRVPFLRKQTPKKILSLALDSAAAHGHYVSPPYTFLSI
jgi:ATP-dependent protease HslVU (ClpYQ) peptidase subunit